MKGMNNMRFTIRREEFVRGLTIASRAVASKTPVAALANLKLELDENGLTITGSNYDLSIRTVIPHRIGENEVIRNYKEGTTLLNAKILLDIVRKLESEEVTIEVTDSTIATIANQKGSNYTLNCIRPEEYPDLDLEVEGTTLAMTTAEFALMVDQTAFAASTKEQRPVLTAINLEAREGLLTATTTDSARMAKKIMTVPEDVVFNVNVPAKMMVEVARLLENSPSVEIAVSQKKALFAFGKTLIATRLIAGDYPNTSNIIPRVSNHTLEVNAQELIKAIDRANILSIDRENIVDLSMSEEGVEISAKSSQVGSAVEKLEIYRYEGNPLTISFNSEFVVAAVRALSSEDVTFSFVGEMKPFVIKNSADDSIVQVVTPVRTY